MVRKRSGISPSSGGKANPPSGGSGLMPKPQQTSESYRRIVDLCAQLKTQADGYQALFNQADRDRRDLLRLLGNLAKCYHEEGVDIDRLGGTEPRDDLPASHTDPIATCEQEVCATVREGMLAIGTDRGSPSTELVRQVIAAKTGGGS